MIKIGDIVSITFEGKITSIDLKSDGTVKYEVQEVNNKMYASHAFVTEEAIVHIDDFVGASK